MMKFPIYGKIKHVPNHPPEHDSALMCPLKPPLSSDKKSTSPDLMISPTDPVTQLRWPLIAAGPATLQDLLWTHVEAGNGHSQ